MSKKIIKTDKAPAAIGPYSQGVITGYQGEIGSSESIITENLAKANLLFTSGQLPIDPATGKLVDGSIEDKACMVFKNLAAIADAAGTSLDKAVKTTVFLTDINNFKAVNTVYAQYFKEPFPARSAFQVAALPLGADIEVEAIFEL